MFAARNASVVNSGTISANGINAVAIVAIKNADVINSGVIRANCNGGVAISVDQLNANLTNSGTTRPTGLVASLCRPVRMSSRPIPAPCGRTVSAASGIRASQDTNLTNSGIIMQGTAAAEFFPFEMRP